MGKYRILLTLLDISKSVEADDDKGTTIVRLVNQGVLKSPCPARLFLQNNDNKKKNQKPSKEEIENIQNQVLRFLRVRDKWTALASTLVKSQSFHLVYSSRKVFSKTPIIELPRTQYRKPFIPVPILNKNNEEKEETIHPLSVSHQYPFVGEALLMVDDDDDDDDDDENRYRPKVGFDLVVFETYNKRLYSNQDEFISVFRNSFTEREWNCINQQPNSSEEEILCEFYFRWAMKEAYTKALGVGMGFEFNSFDICLSSVDDKNDEGIGSVWQWLVSSSNNNNNNTSENGIYCPGSVKFLAGQNEKEPENWDFFFLPLYEKGITNHVDEIRKSSGGACVCIGPFMTTSSAQEETDEEATKRHLQVDLKWTDIDSLIEWHQL